MLTSSPSPSASGLGELDELLLFIAGESTEACLPEFDVADDSDEEDDEQYRYIGCAYTCMYMYMYMYMAIHNV